MEVQLKSWRWATVNSLRNKTHQRPQALTDGWVFRINHPFITHADGYCSSGQMPAYAAHVYRYGDTTAVVLAHTQHHEPPSPCGHQQDRTVPTHCGRGQCNAFTPAVLTYGTAGACAYTWHFPCAVPVPSII